MRPIIEHILWSSLNYQERVHSNQGNCVWEKARMTETNPQLIAEDRYYVHMNSTLQPSAN